MIEVHLGVFEEFVGAGILVKQPDKFLYPFVFVWVGTLNDTLVVPMSGNAMFGNTVHFRRADLDFNPMILRAKKISMERPVSVPFRGRDIVLETPHNGWIDLMQLAKSTIAILNRRHQNPESHNVGQLVHCHCLGLHLAPDGIG